MPTFKDHNRITQGAIVAAMIKKDPSTAETVGGGVCFTLTLEWLDYLRQNSTADPYAAWETFHAWCLNDPDQLQTSTAHFTAYKTWFDANKGAAAGVIITKGAEIVSAGLTVSGWSENRTVADAAETIAAELEAGKTLLLCFRRRNEEQGQYGHTVAFAPFTGPDGAKSVVFLDVSFGAARVNGITHDKLVEAVKRAAGENTQDVSCAHIS